MSAAKPIVRVRDLHVRFDGEQTVHAVNGIDFDLRPGEVLGILGESGSGKSVTLKALMRLLPERRTAIDGSITIDGHDVLSLAPEPLADFRGRTVSMIFQEPMLALDPVFTIGHQIAESVQRHEGVDHATADKRALDMLERVRIPSPARRLKAYPHEMSGGMRQRAMIALALACRPKVLLADEPTTALDATVQIQILLLLRELQREFGMAVIFVTHDIGAAIEVSDQVAVMYGGRFVETGPVAAVLGAPAHPYTKGLLASTVHGAMRGQRLEAIPGTPPSLLQKPAGCAFAPRCRVAMAHCATEMPPATALSADHDACCWAVAGAAPDPKAKYVPA